MREDRIRGDGPGAGDGRRAGGDRAAWPSPRVRVWGSASSRPLVLLHGFMQSEEAWARVAPELARDFYVLAPRMWPETAAQARPEGLVELVDGVVGRACQRTGCDEVALVGYSMGGRIALGYAAARPRALSALVLESAGLGPADARERAQLERRGRAWARRLRAHAMRESVDWWQSLPLFATQDGLPEEVRAGQRSMRLACDRRALALLAEHAGQHAMASADSNRALLARARFPVLYVAGRHDRKYADVAASLRGVVTRTELLDCGHDAHLEAPEAFVDRVRAFLLSGRG